MNRTREKVRGKKVDVVGKAKVFIVDYVGWNFSSAIY